MNGGTWIAIYMPIFILLFVILPQKREREKGAILKIKKKKGVFIMTNEVIQKFIGKECHISTGGFGVNLVGKVISVNENWIEVQTKKDIEIVNSDFIQHITVKVNK